MRGLALHDATKGNDCIGSFVPRQEFRHYRRNLPRTGNMYHRDLGIAVACELV
jgi:hypothetical protein